MTTRDWQNLPAMFFDWAARRGDRPFLWRKLGTVWTPIRWDEAALTVRRLARGLRALGIEPGDRVALIAENRPEWMLADLAIMAAGGITVPAYTSYTPEDYRHVLSNSGAKALVLSTNALAQRVLPAADQLTYLGNIVAMEPLKMQSGADVHGWNEILAIGAAAPDDVDATIAGIGPDDVACLIYTSGTGGVPKGVMLTHRNVMIDARGAQKVLEAAYGVGDEVFLSFLPLTHSYEHTAGMIFPIMCGADIYFAGGADTLAADMPEVRPTIMTAVPRLCEMLHRRIQQTAERKGGRSYQLFQLTLRLGIKRHQTGRLNWAERIGDFILDRLVRKKIRARFGGRLKAFVCGGAPLNRDVGLFFIGLGIDLLQGYGQTEASPVIAVNHPGRIKVDSVGPALDQVELRIAGDGEILVRGPTVMKGYWNDAEATARAIRNGWLHTGDVGQLDADGFLTITDRKRDFIKNTGGEMISPQRIEGLLALQADIGQAMVYGDRKPYVVALIVPDDAVLTKFAKPAQQQRIAAAIAAVNRDLAPAERIRRFAIIDEPFSVANGQMTPTLKIKRHMIRAAHGAVLESLYEARSGG